MKKSKIVFRPLFLASIAICFISIQSIQATEQRNDNIAQMVFYNFPSVENEENDPEVDSDFYYSIELFTPFLEKNKIELIVKHKPDFTIVSLKGKNIIFKKSYFIVDVGYLVIKSNGEYKVFKGVGTDIDMMMDINDFLEMELTF